MRCSFCLDDLENHTHSFRSEYEMTELENRPVYICGTCVRYFELQMHLASEIERVQLGHVQALEPLRRWEDDGGPPA